MSFRVEKLVRTVGCGALALTLALPSASRAEPPASVPLDREAQAKALVKEAEALLRSGAYAEARGQFSAALDAAPAELSALRARIRWGRVQALLPTEQRCEAQADLRELDAMVLPPVVERSRADIERAREQLAACSDPSPPGPSTDEDGEGDAGPAGPPTEGATVIDPPKPRPQPAVESPAPEDSKPPAPRGRVLRVMGGVITGIGVAGLAGMTVALGLGARAERRFHEVPDERLALSGSGTTLNNAARELAIIGGVTLLAGVILLAAGVKLRRTPRGRPSAVVHPRMASVAVTFSF